MGKEVIESLIIALLGELKRQNAGLNQSLFYEAEQSIYKITRIAK